jgi:hypothetical protein
MESRADRGLEAELAVAGGLFWLKPGVNSFGADAGNAIVFPKGPAHADLKAIQKAPGMSECPRFLH